VPRPRFLRAGLFRRLPSIQRPTNLTHRSRAAPLHFWRKTKNCSRANSSNASPTRDSPDPHGYTPVFLSFSRSCAHCPWQRQASIAAKGENEQLSLTVVAFQSFRHPTPKPPPSKTEGGAPPSHYSAVNCESGMLS
jgi:hypothetical protein